MTQIDNKKIAKNTLYMYLRMLVTMAVSLFTTRIVFRALGVDNFGIYNVVGSVIVFFTFINSGLTTATRRYITAELAQGDEDSQQNVFNLAVWAHVLISGIVFLLAETVGLWAVNSFLNIPDERMFAANVVYQLSVFSAVLTVMQSPFTAAITANERMNIYAYLSILDVLLKLALAYVVMVVPGDKLVIYAVSVFVVGFIGIVINRAYCYRVFSMCRYKRPHNRALLKEMFGYMGWNLAGQGMVVMTNQGVTLLVNMFFSVAANAAMGISNQITNIVNGFVTNFQIAFHPQITKLYVSNGYSELNNLSNRCARISSFLVLIFLIPICFQINNFLSLWLGDYPDYAVEFCVYTLIAIFIDSMSAPLWMILSADKDVRKYQIVISLIYSLNFFIGWCVLAFAFPPYSVIIVRIGVYCIAVLARLLLVKERIPSFSILLWFKEIPLKTLLAAIIPVFSCFLIEMMTINNSLGELLIKGGLAFIITSLSVFYIGMKKTERQFVFNKFLKR